MGRWNEGGALVSPVRDLEFIRTASCTISGPPFVALRDLNEIVGTAEGDLVEDMGGVEAIEQVWDEQVMLVVLPGPAVEVRRINFKSMGAPTED